LVLRGSKKLKKKKSLTTIATKKTPPHGPVFGQEFMPRCEVMSERQ
jgi:hypothetical protein